MFIQWNRFFWVLALVALAAGGLAGCGSEAPKDIRIRGEIALAGHGELPDQATARISLIEHTGNDGDNRIVAEKTLHDLKKTPVAFDLSVNPQLFDPNSRYGLSAQVLDRTGNIRWETPVPQSLIPAKQNGTTTLMLQTNDFRSIGPFDAYRCQDDFRFELARQKDRAILRMGNRQISLTANQTVRKKATVYTNNHGDELAFGYNKITLSIDGSTHMNCVATSPDGPPPQPVQLSEPRASRE